MWPSHLATPMLLGGGWSEPPLSGLSVPACKMGAADSAVLGSVCSLEVHVLAGEEVLA